MFKKYSFIFFLLATFQVFSAPPTLDETSKILHDTNKKDIENAIWNNIHIGDYPYNPHVSLEVWEMLKPYFLPFNSSTRVFLDMIFQNQRATLNRESLAASGFQVPPPRQPGNLTVTSHPLFKGYLFKVYLDTQDNCESHNFFERVTGARSIAKCIKKHGYQNHFKVPKKWIYPLPLDPSPPDEEGYFRKNFILVVEDMHILGHGDNSRSFHTLVTPELLDELYIILTEEGLIDSVYRGNIPFNAEGQMNFIDTEHHHRWPINYNRLRRYLSPEMDAYWEHITHHRNASTEAQ